MERLEPGCGNDREPGGASEPCGGNTGHYRTHQWGLQHVSHFPSPWVRVRLLGWNVLLTNEGCIDFFIYKILTTVSVTHVLTEMGQARVISCNASSAHGISSQLFKSSQLSLLSPELT